MTFRGRVDVDGDDGVHAQQPCAKKPFWGSKDVMSSNDA